MLQRYCWDVLDAEHEDWRDHGSVRLHVDRDPLSVDAPNLALRRAVEETQRRITVRSYVATARRPTFDHPPGIHLASSKEVAEHKSERLDEVRALADAGRRDLARKQAMRVFQMPEEDESMLDAAELLLELGDLTDPAAAFARERIARSGSRLATRYGRTELADTFDAVIETSWAYLEKYFIGTTYYAEGQELPVLVLDISQTVDHGNDSMTPIAVMQNAAGELGETDARIIASGAAYRMVEDGSGTRPLASACEAREHEFSHEDLQEYAPVAICENCGLSRDVIRDLLGQDVPSVCAECKAVVYQTEVRRITTGDRMWEETVCVDCTP